jgi:hypothetical protein
MLVGESYNLVENVTGDGLVSNVKTMELAGSIYRASLAWSVAYLQCSYSSRRGLDYFSFYVRRDIYSGL